METGDIIYASVAELADALDFADVTPAEERDTMKIIKESSRWVSGGIISNEQREEIIRLYRKENPINPMLILLSIIGSLLLGLGTILIFASNWDNISREAKTVVAFLPLLIAIAAVAFNMFKKPDSVSFREASTLGLFLSILATIALIEQVFQIPTTVPEYLSLCILLFLPALYLRSAKAPTLIYLICMIWIGASGDMPLWFSYLNLALFIPYLIREIKKAQSNGILFYLTMLSGAALSFSIFLIPGINFYITYKFLIIPLFLLAFEAVVKRFKPNSMMPLTFVSAITVVITHIVFSFRGAGIMILNNNGTVWFFLLCALAFGAYLIVRLLNREFSFKDLSVADATVITIILGLPLFWLWSNVLLVALGVYLMFLGNKRLNLKLINSGLLIICSVIVARFFDANMELLARGIVFILVGAAFMFTNILLHKKWRQQ